MGLFYPAEVRSRDRLRYYAERFKVVEVNATFYRLPEATTFDSWFRQTPDDFIFALKASRFLSHLKRLKDPAEPVQLFLHRADGLKKKLGPILIQLPPNFKCDAQRLRAALEAFPRNLRLTVEFRHESWFTDEIREILTEFHAALCLADRKGSLVSPPWRTADWGYVRFHQGEGESLPCYKRETLRRRAEEIADRWGKRETVFVFFNNDPGGCALRDAIIFGEELSSLGCAVTRLPDPQSIVSGQ
jgi:uncharacterized protein YecE (DUF72 family)